ncbi:unnamed protein product [Penicillium pancosmium]
MSPSLSAVESFSAPAQNFTFDGILSDFDGTIVDSTAGMSVLNYSGQLWVHEVRSAADYIPSNQPLSSTGTKQYRLTRSSRRIAAELGVDPEVILATSHGRRSIDTMALYDESKANWECTPDPVPPLLLQSILTTTPSTDVNYIEGRIPKEYGSDAKEIPGGRDLLRALETSGAKWGVVTSGTRALIDGWLEVLGLTHPEKLVVAEDVPLGKPDPRCYLLGRKQIELENPDSTSVLVLEDAPSGIKAGKAAGFKVLALATTHSLEQLRAAGADWIVEDLRSLVVTGVVDGKVNVEIRNALQ